MIADITNPKLPPIELQATFPDHQIPFVAIIQEEEDPKHNELRLIKAREPKIRSASDFIDDKGMG